MEIAYLSEAEVSAYLKCNEMTNWLSISTGHDGYYTALPKTQAHAVLEARKRGTNEIVVMPQQREDGRIFFKQVSYAILSNTW